MSKPVVLQIVADGAAGGGTTFVLGLCADLAAQGWCEPVLCTQKDSYASAAAAQAGLRVVGLDFFRSRLDPAVPRELARIVDEMKPDVIHAHGSRAGRSFCAGVLRKNKIPLVYTVHGYHFENKPFPLNLIFRAVEKKVARRCDHLVFVSHGDEDLARRYGLAKDVQHSVIYNGIDPRDLDAVSATEEKIDLLYLARMHRQKNPLFMIDIMKFLRGSGLRLAMVGGGDLLEAAQAKARAEGVAENVVFTGPVARSGAVGFIKKSKLLIQPSLWEGLPITPIEASYCGVPVVASNVPGTDEIVRDGENGVLVTGFDAARFADTIRRLIDEPARRDAMGEAGRRLVATQFLRVRSSEAYADAYRALLARDKGA